MCWDCEHPEPVRDRRLDWLAEEIGTKYEEIAIAQRLPNHTAIVDLLVAEVQHLLMRYNALRLDCQAFDGHLKVV